MNRELSEFSEFTRRKISIQEDQASFISLGNGPIFAFMSGKWLKFFVSCEELSGDLMSADELVIS